MPTYEYECKTCDKIFEVFQSMSAEKLKECPTCKSPVRRLIGTGSGIVFKGTGFYETDFKTKKGSVSKNSTTVSTSGATKETQKTESKTSESKPSSEKK